MIAGHVGDRQVAIDGLGATDPGCRAAALGALRRLNILDYKILTTALIDESITVQRRALQLGAVLHLPDEPETDNADSAYLATERTAFACAVVALLDNDDVAEEAAFCLGELGITEPGAVDRLEHQARHHQDSLCRESAVAALGSLGVGLQTVLGATGDIATVRRRAVIALAAFNGPAVEEALTRALEDRDWQVRQAAEDLLDPQGGGPDDSDGHDNSH